MIYANADGGAVFFTNIEERDKTVAYLLQFGGIFFVGIFQKVKCLYFVNIVTGVDAHFLHLFGGCVGGPGVEMNIGDKRSRVSLAVQFFPDLAQVTGFAFTLCGETYIFAAGFDHTDSLADSCFGIHRGYIGHGLDTYRIFASQRRVSYIDNR